MIEKGPGLLAKNKNVFIVTQNFPPSIGGIQTVMAGLASRFSKLQCSVFVLPSKKAHTSHQYKTFFIPLPKFLRPYFKKFTLKKVAHRQDLIICDSWKSLSAIPKANDNIVIFAHGQEYVGKNKKVELIQKSLDRAKVLIASSEFTKSLILKNFKIPAEKIAVIAPTYQLSKAVYSNEKRPNRIVNILSICRLEMRKGLIQSVISLAKINNQEDHWQWTIVGDGPLNKDLKQLIEKTKLSGKIRILGWITEEEKISLLKKADLFLMPSYIDSNSLEGFGISYAEAAMYGVPSIAGSSGGAAEAVINNKTGWCTDALNQKELMKTIFRALKNHDLRNSIGKDAQKYFTQNYSGEVVFDQLLKLIEKNMKIQFQKKR